jgi:hypothetical protein
VKIDRRQGGARNTKRNITIGPASPARRRLFAEPARAGLMTEEGCNDSLKLGPL